MTSIAIIGGGPAGFMAAISAAENAENKNIKIVIFEKNEPLKTILCTGNGRCNITNNIVNYRELASNYPRGEKFLYSVFSRFAVTETIEWFKNNGVRLYTQDDNRMFPTTDKAETIRDMLLQKVKSMNIKVYSDENVINIEKVNDIFKITTDNSSYSFDKLIMSTGGSTKNNYAYNLAEKLGIKSTERKPSLVGLKIRENYLTKLSGVSVSSCIINLLFNNKKVSKVEGDFIITHKGISGPVIFKASAAAAFLNYNAQYPLILEINFAPTYNYETLNEELLEKFDSQKNTSISNLLKTYLPKSLAVELLNMDAIEPEKKSGDITKLERKAILDFILNFKLTAIATFPEGEMVTAGGVDLKQINSKTLAAKSDENIFFCGEILDIDGYTGGFNLQQCWSTGYIAGLSAVI
ncbi:MAG: NAD(P)/FAD-dependent oxidoreductase [bacterium]